MVDYTAMIAQCAPDIAPHILERIIKVESSFNPYAIGVVNGRLVRQPINKSEAVATAMSLHNAGWNFSMGLGQINRHNLSPYGLDYELVFDPCLNMQTASKIFNECLRRAESKLSRDEAVLAAYSCYYSGNFTRGFKPEGANQSSYVDRILAVAPTTSAPTGIPIEVISTSGNSPTRKNTSLTVTAKNGEARISSPQKRMGGVKELRGE
ncbi:lytic transglycosylase domain-containing protein [Edaphovirga cremea]|uniref:lytic transglycosylase domain-containing protein n=1 Tax=Edaphovirga cremea TaxID=2267246 RepID=UPI000DEEEC1D|nr:lytic transglycosylase domain-containing protein [Edaphovirga cremea]